MLVSIPRAREQPREIYLKRHACQQIISFSFLENHFLKSFLESFLEIVPDLKGWKVPILQQTRKDEVIMCRSRLGHARLTHSYLFRNEDPPECIYCACSLTVKHILIECPDFELSRQKYFNCNTLPDLFEKHQKQIL